ncbi:hypothetical protein B0H10DRAFT_1944123 [Mycena sp. CBHHK59/15]|nr:hypothetical protein B0H10DRAFT_1944123 [Mycena sp. CBHHK59/15]
MSWLQVELGALGQYSPFSEKCREKQQGEKRAYLHIPHFGRVPSAYPRGSSPISEAHRQKSDLSRGAYFIGARKTANFQGTGIWSSTPLTVPETCPEVCSSIDNSGAHDFDGQKRIGARSMDNFKASLSGRSTTKAWVRAEFDGVARLVTSLLQLKSLYSGTAQSSVQQHVRMQGRRVRQQSPKPRFQVRPRPNLVKRPVGRSSAAKVAVNPKDGDSRAGRHPLHLTRPRIYSARIAKSWLGSCEFIKNRESLGRPPSMGTVCRRVFVGKKSAMGRGWLRIGEELNIAREIDGREHDAWG